MLQKVLIFANYAEAVLVWKMLFCSSYAKKYASTIRQGLDVCAVCTFIEPYMKLYFV